MIDIKIDFLLPFFEKLVIIWIRHSYIIQCNGGKMVIVSHLFSFYKRYRDRESSQELFRSLFYTTLFPDNPLGHCPAKLGDKSFIIY